MCGDCEAACNPCDGSDNFPRKCIDCIAYTDKQQKTHDNIEANWNLRNSSLKDVSKNNMLESQPLLCDTVRSLNNIVCVDEHKENEHHGDNDIIDLCSDSISSIDSDDVGTHITPKESNCITTSSPKPKRPRLIDLCLQRAYNDDVSLNNECLAIEDDDDQFLADLKLNKNDEVLHPKNVPEFYFPFLYNKNISQEEKHKKLSNGQANGGWRCEMHSKY